ncbi:TetR family transcriptional regulator [Nocardia sp. NPDC005998]|uniref:TetR/AcrR family transcriptional regulator n=1 Tax=Nocardia sp. NPDC005998 TaxID=3156894 RepID=UPI0033AFF302
MTNPTAEPTLWERSRQIAVREILDTAIRLFEEQGYDNTTVAQIAREAGISQRSLFRYFGTKEDLVCGDQDALGELLRQTVDDQPVDVSAWDALRVGFLAIMTDNHTPDQVLRLSTLIFDTPSLHAGYVTKRLRWQANLVPVIERRLGIAVGSDQDPRARAIIATVFACVDAASVAWVRSGGRSDIAELYDRSLAAVTSGRS